MININFWYIFYFSSAQEEIVFDPLVLTCLWICDGCQPFLLQLLDSLLVLPQVKFGAHEDDGHVGAVVPHLRVPLGTHVLEGGGVHQRKAYQEDVLEGKGEK